jgi:hypothetical protein
MMNFASAVNIATGKLPALSLGKVWRKFVNRVLGFVCPATLVAGLFYQGSTSLSEVEP